MYIMRKLLVQAYGRFGDNLCVAGAVSQIKDHEIIIATNEEFKDSVLNIPNVKSVLTLDQNQAVSYANANQCILFQATLEHLAKNVQRLDARLCEYFKNIGIDYLKPMSGFFPTESETLWANEFADKYKDKPLLGVESGHTSNQSYMSTRNCDIIVNKYAKDYHILWLCNRAYPTDQTNIIPLGNLPRRNVCALLPKLSLFISSFSGYFWASRALEQPPQTICCVSQQFHDWYDNTNITNLFDNSEFDKFFGHF